MRFERLYRASLYLTLFIASLLMSVDATVDNRFAMLYPVAVALASALAFVTVDRDASRGLPRELANILGLVSFGLGCLEWYNDTSLLLLAIGHTLIYLQIIKTFLPKTVEDDWYLFLLALVVAVIGVYISQSDQVGFLLACWSASSLWTFGLFFLRREALREEAPTGVSVLPPPDPSDPYPGLLNMGFFLAALRVAGTTMALGMVIFFLMPRWTVKGGNRTGQAPSPKHLTGFSETVTLGDMGEILENDNLVMSIEFTDEEDNVITPSREILLRGVTMSEYAKNRWTREHIGDVAISRLRPDIPPGMKEIRQRIKMEATDNDVLFAVRPILGASNVTSGEMVLNKFDGSLFRRELRSDYHNDDGPTRPGKFDYYIRSGAEGPQIQARETYPRDRRLQSLKHLSEELAPDFEEIVGPILAKLTPEQRESRVEVVRALERYLRDGDFHYTLKNTIIDPTVDPVIDFLKNRKEGHCEYFASALTLMCRAAGVPARLVNGFKGGDYNELGSVLVVREKHAHSWVEALVGEIPMQGGDQAPNWLTLDPTPASQRDETVATVGRNGVQFRYLGDYIRSLWTFDVVGFDGDRQERRIYGPIRQIAEDAALGFRHLGMMLRDATKWLYFESYGQFFSFRGFIVSVLAMLLLVAVVRVGYWLVNRILGRSQGRDSAVEARDPGLAFYHRLVRILASHGLERPPAETPREFARRAALILEDRDVNGSRLADVPSLVVDAFYSKRFGLRDLSPETIRDLDTRLEHLESELSAPTAP